MRKLEINKNTKIYVACPANTATGGPELLHQLVFQLSKLGFSAYMFYYSGLEGDNPVHNAYLKYDNNYVEEIEDNNNNILIVPEVNTGLIYDFKHIQKVVWWLSVDNYFHFLSSSIKWKRIVKNILHRLKLYPKFNVYKFNKKENIIHFVQSEYAKQMLKEKNLTDVYFLGDYLDNLFIENQIKKINQRKENIVIYNPKKGIEFTKVLINKMNNVDFVPIQNMTREDVASLLSCAKVYIDFGNHPGKDRIPREAAISGCCIITGKDGSAKYYEDVSIPDDFKYDATNENIEKIKDKIYDCINNYENESKKFSLYREKIKTEQDNFILDIKKIFK